MLIEVAASHDGAGEALERVFEFGDALDDFGRGGLRPDVGIEGDFAFDFLDVLGDGGFAVVFWMDDLGDDACQRIGIGHGMDYKSEIRLVESLERECEGSPLAGREGRGRWLS